MPTSLLPWPGMKSSGLTSGLFETCTGPQYLKPVYAFAAEIPCCNPGLACICPQLLIKGAGDDDSYLIWKRQNRSPPKYSSNSYFTFVIITWLPTQCLTCQFHCIALPRLLTRLYDLQLSLNKTYKQTLDTLTMSRQFTSKQNFMLHFVSSSLQDADDLFVQWPYLTAVLWTTCCYH